jgi:hypothetical protein
LNSMLDDVKYVLLLLLWFSTIKPISLGQEVKYVTILKLLCPSLIG